MNKNWLSLILLMILSSCTGDRCIDADDFGHSILEVPARYEVEELEGQTEDNQVAPWIESDYRLSGKPLAVMVKGWDNGVELNSESEVSAWCPWFGTEDDGKILSDFCYRLKACEFENDDSCADGPDAPIVNPPCLMKNGMGLYGLIADRGTDPNLSIQTRKEPAGFTFHVGAKNPDYAMYDIDKDGNTREVGGRVYQYPDEQSRLDHIDSKLYFKISDKFYDDNSGKYRVVIKSGISRIDADPIVYVSDLVRGFFFGDDLSTGVVKNLYEGIINNAGYRLVVSTLLTLFVMYTGIMYLAGHVELNRTELVVRIAKIALVAALLGTETSWNFFHDNLFVYFVGGLDQILKIIFEVGNTGPGSAGILGLVINPKTFYKLLSLLFTDWLGIVYIVIFLIVIIVLLFIFFQATVIYLTALISISIILIMGPVFICFLLFDFTRSLFDNWLKQLISNAMQPIILFTGIVFISVMIRHEIYASLGFRVCKFNFLTMNGALESMPTGLDAIGTGVGLLSEDAGEAVTQASELTKSLFHWWFPDPMKGEDFSRELKMIPIPEAHIPEGDLNDTEFCEPYGCIGERYVDLPFLDPVKDVRRLNNFWAGQFVQIDGLIYIVISLYLLFKFNGLAVNVARFITDTTTNQSSLQNVASQLTDSLKGGINAARKGIASKVAPVALKGVGKVAGAAGRQIGNRGLISGAVSGALLKVESASNTSAAALKKGKFGEMLKGQAKGLVAPILPSTLIDKARIRILKREALTGSASKPVLKEVERSTGLTRKGLNPNARKDYEKKLTEKLAKGKNPMAAKAIARSLSRQNLKDSGDKLSLAMYGKKRENLSVKEEAGLRKILNDKDLRKASVDAQKAERFKKEYVKAYAKLSDQGVGLIGKRVKVVRIIEKTRHQYKADRRRAKEKDLLLGKRILTIADNDKLRPSKSKNPSRKNLKEMSQEERQNVKDQKLHNKVERHSRNQGHSIRDPELLAKAKLEGQHRANLYKKLSDKEVEADLRNEINSAPEIKADSYMRSKASEAEMRESIDKLKEIEKSFIENDDYIAREEEYKINRLDASERIQNYIKDKDFGKDATLDDLEKSIKSKGDLNPSDQTTLDAIQEYKISQGAIDEVESRKNLVKNNIQERIGRLNQYRKGLDTKLDDYSGK